ncbi:zinc finger matrin-type protein 5 isoform X4 [Pangasianodon hypophthalmus]|uniref:zinc finger matrin-type protein 5 isoform X4 n=1 Tax=Pangasianodon hypophthalmus TaxID=310915 RepID=UPI0023073D61|nr:zinc finger matrin-type protein 5 isoform X4 [Pangasianodon hypophthalmus]
MGKRYHCDYCDRSFQDTLHNRKKHLNGVQHHRAKKAWFDNFRDAAAILQDERAKQACRKFLQTGQCVFGPSCRYSHMSEQDMKDLEQHIHERQQGVDLDQEEATTKPSLEEWLSRREKRAAQSSGRSPSITSAPASWRMERQSPYRLGLKSTLCAEYNVNTLYGQKFMDT